MKRQITIKELQTRKLSKGDLVKLRDGSSLTLLNSDKEFYIIDSHPKVTGNVKILKDIEAVVVETDIVGKLCLNGDSLYKQDTLIAVGTGLFYTNSSMVVKI